MLQTSHLQELKQRYASMYIQQEDTEEVEVAEGIRDFKVGDTVKFVNDDSDYWGQTGKITSLSGNGISQKATVKLDKGGKSVTNVLVKVDLIKEEVAEGWKKGKYTIKDENGKILGTYSSGGKAKKVMDDLMQKGDYPELTVSMVEEVEVAEKFAGWIAIYGGKQLEIKKSEADGIWPAKQLAIKHFKVPKSKLGLLAIAPAEEEVELGEAASKYTIYHKTFTSAATHAKDYAEKQGYDLDDGDWNREVTMGGASGRGRPGEGKTKKFNIGLEKNGKPQKKRLQFQVFGMPKGSYELNMYIEGVELDERHGGWKPGPYNIINVTTGEILRVVKTGTGAKRIADKINFSPKTPDDQMVGVYHVDARNDTTTIRWWKKENGKKVYYGDLKSVNWSKIKPGAKSEEVEVAESIHDKKSTFTMAPFEDLRGVADVALKIMQGQPQEVKEEEQEVTSEETPQKLTE